MTAQKDILSVLKTISAKITFDVANSDKYDQEITIKQNNSKVGTLSLWQNFGNSDVLHLQYVGVDKVFRRQGIGLEAMKYLKKYAKKHGYRTVAAEMTWTGVLDMMMKVFGKPRFLGDAIRQYNLKEAKEFLPDASPENEKGNIEDADYLEAWWDI